MVFWSLQINIIWNTEALKNLISTHATSTLAHTVSMLLAPQTNSNACFFKEIQP